MTGAMCVPVIMWSCEPRNTAKGIYTYCNKLKYNSHLFRLQTVKMLDYKKKQIILRFNPAMNGTQTEVFYNKFLKQLPLITTNFISN